MSRDLAKVQDALEDAHVESTRPGKWSKVVEVKVFEPKANLTTLRQLVKDGAASEKIVKGTPVKLFKPTRAGAAAQSTLGEPGRGKPDRDGPDNPDRGEPDKPPRRGDGKKPRRHGGKKPRRNGDGKKPDRPRKDEGKKPGRPRGDKKPRKTPEEERQDKIDRERRRREREAKERARRNSNKPSNPTQSTIGQGIGTLLVGGIGGSGGAAPVAGPTPYMPTPMM